MDFINKIMTEDSDLFEKKIQMQKSLTDSNNNRFVMVEYYFHLCCENSKLKEELNISKGLNIIFFLIIMGLLIWK